MKNMGLLKTTGASLVFALSCAVTPLYAQTVGQDMKDAGHDTANAGRTVGHDTAHDTKVVARKTKNGTKTGYHKTVNGSKTAYHHTANATSNVGRKIEDEPTKPTPPTKPQ